jgi:type VI secretion system ImpC/EvpB family protein
MSVREQSASSPALAAVLTDTDRPGEATPLLELLLGSAAPGAAASAAAEDLLTRIRASTRRADLAQLLFGERRKVSAKAAARQLDLAIARLDDLLAGQVNAILHHPRWQVLEASWRGLAFLCQQAGEETERSQSQGEDAHVVLRMLSVTKRELWDDATTATQFDQSVLWQKVYEAEFGTAGGSPFGLLVGDYEFRNHPNDLDTLASIAAVAAAAFAPFVAAAAPEFFGLNDYQRLEIGLPLEQDFQRPDYIKWRALRSSEDSRFVGLTLPRVLMRRPHALDLAREDGFRFEEDVADSQRHNRYLWGNAAYAFASVVLRAYVDTGWFAEIRGFERGHESGGLVSGLAVDSFGTDRAGIALKSGTDVVIGSLQERELADLGFMPLCACQGTEFSAFFSNASIHKPAAFAEADANTTARMSAMLQYVLCASRFAHYLKTLSREKIGSLQSVDELNNFLVNWISQYVADDARASPEVKARYPLRQADVQVSEIPGQAGAYRLEMRLLPHYQLDSLSASLRLVHRLPNVQS